VRSVGVPSLLPADATTARYAVALAAGLLAILLRASVEPVLGHVGFYVTVYIAVVFTSLVCGLGPSILTAVIATGGIVYWFVDPRKTFVISDRRDIHGLIACLVVCSVLIALGETNRRKRLQILEARQQLEERVQERTAELSEALARLESEIVVREQAEQQLRQLSVRLMTAQDEERRHIARELHDSAGQTLAAIKMTLVLLHPIETRAPELSRFMDDLDALADEALQQVRTMSYLLHPPLLDEAGIASAARWFVEGFAKRSGLEVHCDIPERMDRLPGDCELVLFRVLQESLTNVHRHSAASAVSITLNSDAEGVTLEIRDNGNGISQERLSRLNETSTVGVGIAGMRERVHELRGHLEIHSSGTGTVISATLPISTGTAAARQR